ncbi:recombinase family protein [Xylanivirga thermophila]|jgi:site-specific DNA recombinase|uniref:hypothetical protein n=1 Tax=Xylanivirga thermophila TaxID=2496273 RepID=UPI001A9329CE|nr:hypothetical protein [Xylanivirga thermophila]
MEKKINYFPAILRKLEKKVEIYCRVSTNDMEQLKNLVAQISALTRMVSIVEQWRLVDTYIDIASDDDCTKRKSKKYSSKKKENHNQKS